MTLAEAEVHILTILKQIMEEKLTSVNIQVGSHWCGTRCAARALVSAVGAREGADTGPAAGGQCAQWRNGRAQVLHCVQQGEARRDHSTNQKVTSDSVKCRTCLWLY